MQPREFACNTKLHKKLASSQEECACTWAPVDYWNGFQHIVSAPSGRCYKLAEQYRYGIENRGRNRHHPPPSSNCSYLMGLYVFIPSFLFTCRICAHALRHSACGKCMAASCIRSNHLDSCRFSSISLGCCGGRDGVNFKLRTQQLWRFDHTL